MQAYPKPRASPQGKQIPTQTHAATALLLGVA